MRPQRFKDGQSVKRIIWSDDSCFEVGVGRVEEINVVMEGGQMGLVPWFAVTIDGVVVSKWNAAELAGVVL